MLADQLAIKQQQTTGKYKLFVHMLLMLSFAQQNSLYKYVL